MLRQALNSLTKSKHIGVKVRWQKFLPHGHYNISANGLMWKFLKSLALSISSLQMMFQNMLKTANNI